MADEKIQGFSRRDFLMMAGGTVLAVGAGGGVGGAASQVRAQSGSSGRQANGGGQNPRIGEPVSQTAAAQDGPKVPGPPERPVGYAVVGLGQFAVGQILPSFAQSDHCRLVALVSGDRAKATAIAHHYRLDPQRSVYGYEEMEALADNPEVDVVYVITPPALHAEHTIRAAQAGKHVLCEKPMATSVEECEAMIQACQSAGRRLMIAYRVHYEPYNQEVMRWSREERMGKVQFVETVQTQDVGGPDQWRLRRSLAGGGALFDLGIYGLQAQLYLTQDMPVEVAAAIHTPRGDERFREVEGHMTWQVRFSNGALATGTTGYAAPSLNRIRAIADEGWYELDPATSYSGQRMFYGPKSEGEREERRQLVLEDVNQFAREMDHFAQCVKEDRDPRTPGEMGLRDVYLMRGIYHAAETGRWVRV